MNYFFLNLCVALVGTAGFANGELSWKHLTRENFTVQHNWELVKGHVRDTQHLLQLQLEWAKKEIPRDISLDQTIFTLYTRNGPVNGVRVTPGDIAALAEGKFDSKKQSIFATHGFLSGGDVEWMIQMKTAHLAVQDCNMFTIDWSYCAGSILYPSAVDCTRIVGGYLAQVVDFLGEQGADIHGMHLLGHSLGAHLVAQLSQHGHQVSRITGWDPAGPLFDSDDLPGRIDPSDADVVDIIHTNCFMFGYDGLLGDYDFFPNGGDDQPGCFPLDYLCDHSMSYFYYIQSLYNNQKYPASKCDSIDNAKKGNCSGSVNYMGAISPNGATGIYYIKVTEQAHGDPPKSAADEA